MRQLLDRLEQFAVDVILERRGGKRAGLLRIVLRGLSFLYLGIVSLRIHLYGSHMVRPHQLGCPVVSIGNLTVGGTGKTPVVEKLARELSLRGRKVAILSRGYKSTRRRIPGNDPSPVRVVSEGGALLLDSKNAGDEPFMLAKNLRGVAVVVDKDRVECGRHAISQLSSDLLILDDGLQYLRLHRRFDIVLIDREAPFGNEYILPRGTLREPPPHLRRNFTGASGSTIEPPPSSNAGTVPWNFRISQRETNSLSQAFRGCGPAPSPPLPPRKASSRDSGDSASRWS